jgi:hypothetical protein
MFKESEKFRTLNQLALQGENKHETLKLEGKTHTVPAIALCDHEPLANLFFKESGENLEMIKVQQEHRAEQDRLANKPAKEIDRLSTSMPSDYRLKMIADEE